MKNSITCIDIIRAYIDRHMISNTFSIATSTISNLSTWGLREFGVLYSPDTYSRKFRKWRQDIRYAGLLHNKNINNKRPDYSVSILPSKSKEKHYQIERIVGNG